MTFAVFKTDNLDVKNNFLSYNFYLEKPGWLSLQRGRGTGSQNRGLKIICKITLAVCSTPALAQMIASLGSDVKRFPLSHSPPHVEMEGDVKKLT